MPAPLKKCSAQLIASLPDCNKELCTSYFDFFPNSVILFVIAQ